MPVQIGTPASSAVSGVSSLIGTANQITVSGPTGDVTLSTPQNIGTGSSPTFAGCTLSGITGLAKCNGASAITAAVPYADYGPARLYLTASPTTGATVQFTSDSRDQLYYITPAGALLALTITLPSNATSVIGQQVRFCITQAVTALTINGASTILNTISALTGGELVCFVKVADNVWSQQLYV